jgi:hypothetical protein
VQVLRVVVRESASEDLLESLVTDLMAVMESLSKADSPQHALAALGQQHASVGAYGGGSATEQTRSSTEHPGADGQKKKTGQEADGQQPTGYGRPC